MKQLTLIFFCIATIMGCKNETAQNETNLEKTSEVKNTVIEEFDCKTFFEKGDYSSICFIDSKLPETINRGCIHSFKTNGNKHEQDITIQFTDKKSTMLAEMHYNMQKSNHKKSTIIDVSNLGDAAFFDVHTTDLKSLSRSNKDLNVRFKNICFKIMVTYQSNTDEPCFYSDKELIAFSQKIIDNL